MSKDHLLGHHERFSPLGPALREPTFDVATYGRDAELALFRFGSHEIDDVEPAVAPPAQPADHAARAFKVGDRVRGIGGCGRYWAHGDVGTVALVEGDGSAWVDWDNNTLGDGQWLAASAHLEPLITPNTVEDGWIAHDGGACPVLGDTMVQVRHRGGMTFRPKTAESWDLCWSTEFSITENDIVAYRIAA